MWLGGVRRRGDTGLGRIHPTLGSLRNPFSSTLPSHPLFGVENQDVFHHVYLSNFFFNIITVKKGLWVKFCTVFFSRAELLEIRRKRALDNGNEECNGFEV